MKNLWGNKKLILVLKNNGVVVMPTDTIYGILGKAKEKKVVERIYRIRKRNPKKPCIILFGDISEIEKFSIYLTEKQKKEFKKQKFVPTSVVFDCLDKRLSYLHRNTMTLAFRIPLKKDLRTLLLKTGPLIAPSANVEGLVPAKNIIEAKKYFGNKVDLYVDGGEITGKASKVIKLHKDGSVSILRE